MILKEVGGDKDLKRMFLEFPVSLYASDPNWIRPLDQDIEVIFDPNKNIHFKNPKLFIYLLKRKKMFHNLLQFYPRNHSLFSRNNSIK